MEKLKRELEHMRDQHQRIMNNVEEIRRWCVLLNEDMKIIKESVNKLTQRMDIVEPSEIEDFYAIRHLRDRVTKLELAKR